MLKQLIELNPMSLKPYTNNPRNNEKAIDAVAASISEFGFQSPIIVDKDHVIICGHTRHAAAERLGLAKVPVIVADELSEEQVTAFRLADNKVAEIADWDMDLLATELQKLDMDMLQFGFTIDDFITGEEPEPYDDDYEIKLPAEPKSKVGQIYQLGRHRLMVGDSTSKDDVDRLLDGNKVELVVTDPPYNVNYEGGTKDKLKIENDNMDDNVFIDFLTAAFENIQRNLVEGRSFYIWFADSKRIQFEQSLINVGLQVRQTLIWNKSALVLGRSDYHMKHEPCLYGWKSGAAHFFIEDRTLTTILEDEVQRPFKNMKKEELVTLLERIYESETPPATIVDEAKPKANDLHPTMKPVPLIAREIKNSSRQGEKVLDLFGGSGTTLIACEQMNRKCYIMEYDPRYADAIIKRYEALTGDVAKLITTKE